MNSAIKSWAISLLLLPHLQAALHAVFPPEQLSQVSGLPRNELCHQKLGYLYQKNILSPLSSFFPARPDPGQLVEASSIDYVADRMSELNTALEDEHTSPLDEQKDSADDRKENSPAECIVQEKVEEGQ